MSGDPYGEERDPERFDLRDVDGKIRICSERCGTCIIGGRDPSMRMSLRPGRLKQMIADAGRGGITCHSTFGVGTAALCFGYEERFGSNLVRVMHRLGALVWVEPPGSQRNRENGDDRAATGVQDQVRREPQRGATAEPGRR